MTRRLFSAEEAVQLIFHIPNDGVNRDVDNNIDDEGWESD